LLSGEDFPLGAVLGVLGAAVFFADCGVCSPTFFTCPSSTCAARLANWSDERVSAVDWQSGEMLQTSITCRSEEPKGGDTCREEGIVSRGHHRKLFTVVVSSQYYIWNGALTLDEPERASCRTCVSFELRKGMWAACKGGGGGCC